MIPTKSELIELPSNGGCLHKFYSVLGIDKLINLFQSWQDKKAETKQLEDTVKNLYYLNKEPSHNVIGDSMPYTGLTEHNPN